MQYRGSSTVTDAGGRQHAALSSARRKSVPCLFDLMSLTDPRDRPADVAELADLVRRGAGPDCDIRVLVADGGRHATTLQGLADTLRCDVYFVAGPTELVDESGDIVALDHASGEPTDWRVVRPSDVPAGLPTWFDLADGRVRMRSGLVTLPVPSGLAFAARDTFIEMAAFVDAAPGCSEGLTPIAASIQSGQFSIGWFDGTSALIGGEDFARLVTASLDEVQPDVRLAIRWPADADDCVTVGEELQRMADALHRNLWVPEPGCMASGIAGLDEPAAVDTTGASAQWVSYVPSDVTTWVAGYETDPDGRLVGLADDISRAAFASTPVDLVPFWNHLETAHRDALRIADAAFRLLRFDRPSDVVTLSRISAAWAAYVPEYELLTHNATSGVTDVQRVVELRERLGRVLEACPSIDEADLPDAARAENIEPIAWPVESDSPALEAASRAHPAHRVPWLPAVPQANAHPVDLYLRASLPPEYLAGHGVSTADGYLLARLSPRRFAAASRSGFLLRIHVPRGTAIKLSEHARSLPARVQYRAREASDIYLLPASWLSAVRVTACYELDGAGGLAAVHDMAGMGLTITFKGADHGVPGLPAGAARWPDRRARATAYLAIPDDLEWISARLASHPGWLPLARRRPHLAPGYRLIEVDVPRRHAIDLPETLAALADVPVAASSLASFAGMDLVLPSRLFRKSTIVKVQTVGPRGKWLADGQMAGRPLAEALPHGVWSDTSSYPVLDSP